MDIYAKPGTKVRYTGIGGYDSDKEYAKMHLEVGAIVTVKEIDVGNFTSYVEFEETPGCAFNTVMFEEVVMEDDGIEEKTRTFLEEQDKFAKAMQEGSERFDKESDEFWESLTYEQQLNAFHSVCKRIYQGDVVDGRSYRGVLYSVFGFGPDSYLVGMECNYMDLHNYIQEGVASYRNHKEKE